MFMTRNKENGEKVSEVLFYLVRSVRALLRR